MSETETKTKKSFINLEKLQKKLCMDLNNLPEGLKISTITMSCNIGTTINIKNVAKYMILEPSNIVTVNYNIKKADKRVIRKVRTLLSDKKKQRKPKISKTAPKKKEDVVNQVSLEILHGSKGPASVKLFTNGAVHITGVRDLKDFDFLIKKIIAALERKVFKLKTTIDTSNNKLKYTRKLCPKPFYDTSQKFKIVDIKVNMINSGFQIMGNINRTELYRILRKEKVECQLEPTSHAGVRIKIYSKYEGKAKKISVFVFESGKILITGANNTKHLHKAYNFIIDILENHDVILMKADDIDDVIQQVRNSI